MIKRDFGRVDDDKSRVDDDKTRVDDDKTLFIVVYARITRVDDDETHQKSRFIVVYACDALSCDRAFSFLEKIYWKQRGEKFPNKLERNNKINTF